MDGIQHLSVKNAGLSQNKLAGSLLTHHLLDGEREREHTDEMENLDQICYVQVSVVQRN